MFLVSGYHSWIACKQGLTSHAALDFRKPHRRARSGGCMAQRKLGDGSTSVNPSNVKRQSAHRPKKPTIWHNPSQDARQVPSTRRSSSAPKKFARQAYKQTGFFTRSINDLRRPQTSLPFTKQEKQAAISLARGGRPEAALTGFCDTMDALLTAAGPRMNHINFAAVITALAHIWEAAQRNDRFSSHAGVRDRIEALDQRCPELATGVGRHACTRTQHSDVVISKTRVEP
ncbi:hypothetical protein ABBQ38_013662 [Trebouxia sp. C0009 RCD-2024]